MMINKINKEDIIYRDDGTINIIASIQLSNHYTRYHKAIFWSDYISNLTKEELNLLSQFETNG